MAFDSSTGRALTFSGLGETYEWNGTAWFVLAPTTNPHSRCGHAMAYDSARKRIVLFGAHNDYPPHQNFDDTWEWDGTNWILRKPLTNPTKRWGYGMVYDAKRRRCVLFGGCPTHNYLYCRTNLNDTWEWDGTTWFKRNATTSPPPRWYHGMAYDSARGLTVLFGGNDGTTVLGDTWEWDGTNWTRRTPRTSPPARFAQGMTYDPVRKRTVIFGGDPVSGPCLDDTWEWDGTNWTQRQPSNIPAARYRPGFAFDTSRKRVLMFSGNSGTPDFAGLTDTWTFDGTNWVRIAPHRVPVRGAIAYDSVRRRTICYGGYMAVSAQPSGTWEWDGTSWLERRPLAQPPARARSAIAFDTKRGRLVMFGGNTRIALPNDTWEWDGTSWNKASPPLSPPGRTGHAAAYATQRGTVVVQGGLGIAGPLFDTWEWNGSQWANRTRPVTPTSFVGHAMAYDLRRQRLVLFGGFDLRGQPLAETWEWEGSLWSRRASTRTPPARHEHSMTYDTVRGRVVLYGGYNGQNELHDTWEWDGSDWMQRTVVRMPRSLPGASMAYDSDRELVVFFGNHTWEYAAANPARTALFGKGCGGSVGTPQFEPATGRRPWIGEVFAMDVTRTPSPLVAIAWLGGSRTTWGTIRLPLDLTGIGMPGCSLLVSPDLLLPVSSSGRVLLAIPPQPSLVGSMLFHQAFVFDRPANKLGIIVSNGVAATIGAR